MEQMTEISQKMYDRAQGIQTVDQAVALLRDCGDFRTLGDILRSVFGPDQTKKAIVDGLCVNHPEASRDSVDRKVRNWLNGRTQSVSKTDAFELALMAGLSLEAADLFLKQVTGEGIHWRNVEDVLWSYALYHQYSYVQTQDFIARCSNLISSCKQIKTERSQVYTAEIEQKIRPVLRGSESDLISFLKNQSTSFGSAHNTAYSLFQQYMEILENGGTGDYIDDGPKMTARYILENYLYREIIPVVKRDKSRGQSAFDVIQRTIRANWPDEQTLSRMKSREIEVPRKVLMMLFLATDGGDEDSWSGDTDDFDDYDDEPLSRDELFQDVSTRMNKMLHSCGFQELDPRNPFDWIVLFSICVDDLWDADARIKSVLENLFPDGNENQNLAD